MRDGDHGRSSPLTWTGHCALRRISIVDRHAARPGHPGRAGPRAARQRDARRSSPSQVRQFRAAAHRWPELDAVAGVENAAGAGRGGGRDLLPPVSDLRAGNALLAQSSSCSGRHRRAVLTISLFR
ncbi:hypothetical protein HBB16_12015 [Pseudonocardia sp. MCCB 268]|nr:hypothetical protein [Pseudonocardia cytotoxica]